MNHKYSCNGPYAEPCAPVATPIKLSLLVQFTIITAADLALEILIFGDNGSLISDRDRRELIYFVLWF